MQKITLSFLLLLGIISAKSQNTDSFQKEVRIIRTDKSPVIDGVLDDEVWASAYAADNFIEHWPITGGQPSVKTEVKVIYNNTGIYIGAMLYDSSPDSIMKELSLRDNIGNADWFGVFIDAYRDGNNGVGFMVTASNVQTDVKYSSINDNDNGDIESGDDSWDAVWDSAVKIMETGWVVEMKIPYSALRFPDKTEQIWNINFGRLVQRLNEKSFWQAVDTQKGDFLTQTGFVSGIKNIKSPVRLQATPFIAVYGQQYHNKNNNPVNSYGRSFNGGMDVKYGINDAFTLDMTLIPDFGEAQSDNQELNLSPFEQRFDENRQFFTEGTELFNKGNLFYSRRVGGQPLHYWEVDGELNDGESIVSNPYEVQLYNATKISGRTSKGLGIGFFNATAGKTEAIIRTSEGEERTLQTSPLTNYNVLVFDQNLKNSSYVSLINTTVMRAGGDYDANVTGSSFSFRNKANSYELSGKGVLSQKYFVDRNDLGHTWNTSIRKIKGRWTFNLNYNEESDTYDPNDLGFLYNNNERSVSMNTNYNIYKPVWKFNAMGAGFWTSYSKLYEPNDYNSYGINGWFWVQTKSFWNINVFNYFEPFETFDYFETRTEGRYYKEPTNKNWGISVRSDARKRFGFRAYTNYRKWNDAGRHRWNWNFSPRFRASDKLSFDLSISNNNFINDVGFASKVEREEIDAETGKTTTFTDIIFGHRDQITVVNTFGTQYAFTANMALTFRLRHYWSIVNYRKFHLLETDGSLAPTDYNENRDQNYNAFTIDMVYRWRFAPGSDLFVVWKNSIFSFDEFPDDTYIQNFDGLLNEPQTNSLSIKLIYYLDYLKFVK